LKTLVSLIEVSVFYYVNMRIRHIFGHVSFYLCPLGHEKKDLSGPLYYFVEFSTVLSWAVLVTCEYKSIVVEMFEWPSPVIRHKADGFHNLSGIQNLVYMGAKAAE